MGKTNTIMFKTICITLLVIMAIKCQAPTTNQLDTCLKSIKSNVHGVLGAVNLGLQQNWLDMAKSVLEAAADGIQTAEDCQKVQADDCLRWVDQNATQGQSQCLSRFAAMGISIKKAQQDMQQHADQATILADWADVVSKLDDASGDCIVE